MCSTDAWSCTNSSSSSSLVTGPSQNRFQAVNYLKQLLWLIPCLSLWPHSGHPFQVQPASFFCKHPTLNSHTSLNLKPLANAFSLSVLPSSGILSLLTCVHSERLLRKYILNDCWGWTFWTTVEEAHSEQLLRKNILNGCWGSTFWTTVEEVHSERLLRKYILNNCWGSPFWTTVEEVHFPTVEEVHFPTGCETAIRYLGAESDALKPDCFFKCPCPNLECTKSEKWNSVFQTPQLKTASKTVSKALGLGNAGSLTLSAKTDRFGYCPGESIALTGLCINGWWPGSCILVCVCV